MTWLALAWAVVMVALYTPVVAALISDSLKRGGE